MRKKRLDDSVKMNACPTDKPSDKRSSVLLIPANDKTTSVFIPTTSFCMDIKELSLDWKA